MATPKMATMVVMKSLSKVSEGTIPLATSLQETFAMSTVAT